MDVVIDLETMGTTPNSVIMEIGAAGRLNGGAVAHFCIFPSKRKQTREGATLCPKTLAWWEKQDPNAYNRVLFAKEEGVGWCMREFNAWLSQFGSDVRVWGNGAAFDLGILSQFYARHGGQVPWKFWNERDLRTLFDLHGGKPEIPDVNPLPHSGVHDAEHELKLLEACIGL